jgi:hypothetical protein
VRVGDKDGCQCAQSAYDGQSQVLVRPSKSIFAEAAEIGHIDGKRGEKPNDDVESRHGRVPRVHVAGCNLELPLDQRTATKRHVSVRTTIQSQCRGNEKVAYPLVTMTAHKNKARNVGGTMMPFTQNKTRSLEIGISARAVCMNQYRKTQSSPAAILALAEAGYLQLSYRLTVYASTWREMVGKVDETWPDRFDASLEEVAGLDCEDCRPHECDKCYKKSVLLLDKDVSSLPRMQMAGKDPYMPKTLRIMTGNGTA